MLQNLVKTLLGFKNENRVTKPPWGIKTSFRFKNSTTLESLAKVSAGKTKYRTVENLGCFCKQKQKFCFG